MNLLRFYLMIGGGRFNAASYADAAMNVGIHTGRSGYIKNPKRKNKNLDDPPVFIESGIPGTFGEGYFIWQSEIFNYADDKNVFESQFSMPMGSEYSQLWIKEEGAMIKFLIPFANNMPKAKDHCIGEYFIIFKAIYGSLDDGGCVGVGYSEKIVNLLSKIGAGFQSDCEQYDIHFSRIEK
ncbi:hypothetical protein [Acidovorax sp. NCPPB 4044]|uniref:hypothetical protein n=1 Tax=Acidovorax sp. NCPPB 4044 TaxID=2940490 RepID=UPI002303276B|nr:hypothetical protein [Acidovorax sp. NCPPB 4044]MDA8522419.1 hypothetical protein [Acidovorax sp. NCPPB 4044]